MGLFKTENCPICGLQTGAFSKSSAKYDGLFVCQDCAKKLSVNGISLLKLKKFPLEELKGMVGASQQTEQEHQEEIALFNAKKRVGNFIHFDDMNKKFAIPKTGLSGKIKDLRIYNYTDLIDYELIEDGNSISKGGVGRALVGGALFGGVGAIVGGSTGHKRKNTCSKLQIKITMNNIESPTVYINFIEAETKKDGFLYKQVYSQAQEALSILNIITQPIKTDLEPTTKSNTTTSSADEILKFKQLLDSGIISQEEFETKKQQLLGL
ncbi:MAG: SHOCT domain-containing protein, partial [Clostridia bacterium]